jgi:hypothetical protein
MILPEFNVVYLAGGIHPCLDAEPEPQPAASVAGVRSAGVSHAAALLARAAGDGDEAGMEWATWELDERLEPFGLGLIRRNGGTAGIQLEGRSEP